MMKKNKLYTVNKYNKPMFMPQENLFDGLSGSSQMSTPQVNWSNPLQRAAALGTTAGITSGWSSMVDTTNPFAPGNLSNALGIAGTGSSGSLGTQAFEGLAGTAGDTGGSGAFGAGTLSGGLLNLGAGIAGGLAKSAISGGLSSGAGDAVGSLGSTVGGMVGKANPILGAAINFGSGLVGGVINKAFGTSVDEKKLAEANANISKMNSFTSNAGSFDEIQGPEAVNMDTDAYSGGWFSGSEARRKNRELKNKLIAAKSFANRSVENNIFNLQDDQMNNALANYSAFGGPIYNDMDGAIEYGFMSDYLDNKRKQTEQKEKLTNMFTGTPSGLFADGGYVDFMSRRQADLDALYKAQNSKAPLYRPLFAFGGDMQTNGADFGTGLTHIDAGGSHEMNPNDGVQMGIDNEGIPNLVEEGETVYDDYVFSNRILADEATKQMFRLPKKKDITFAEISKKLEKEIAERPNDPISKAGFEAQMQTLEEQQERQKSAMEAERARAAFEALSPEEQTAVMQQAAQQEAMAQEAAEEQAIAEQQAMQQPSPEGVAMMQQQADGSAANVGQVPMMAEGGRLFKDGGTWDWQTLFSMVNDFSKQRGNNANRYRIDTSYDGDVEALEGSDDYKKFTDYILNKATDEERLNYFKWIDANTGRVNKYIENGKLRPDWKENYEHARNDHKYGIQHYNPNWIVADGPAALEKGTTQAVEPKIYHALEGDEDYLPEDQSKWSDIVGEAIGEPVVVGENGDKVIYHARKAPAGTAAAPGARASDGTGTGTGKAEGNGSDDKGIVPDLRKETSYGMFGPLVNLGLMTAGIGKPDYSDYDAAVKGAGRAHLAHWMPRGDFAVYKPDDPWFYTMPIIAQSNATQRAIANKVSPSKGAETLANSYNTIIGLGNAQRQASENNFKKYMAVKDYNAGVYESNAQRHDRNSQFNAAALNDAEGRNLNAQLHAAQAKQYGDAQWYNSLYGNINGIFDRINQWEKWKRDHNTIAKMYANGLAGVVTSKTPVAQGYVTDAAKGGKLKKKKNKRGLTF